MHSNENGQINFYDNDPLNHESTNHALHCSSSSSPTLTSVAEKRRHFEKLSFNRKTTSNSAETSSASLSSHVITIPNQPPPPKPKRTFAHDHYFSLNTVNNGVGTNSSSSTNDVKKNLAEKLNFNNNSTSSVIVNKKELNIDRYVAQPSSTSVVHPAARPKLIVCRPIVKRWNTTLASNNNNNINVNGKVEESQKKFSVLSSNGVNEYCLPTLTEDSSKKQHKPTNAVTKGVVANEKIVATTKRPKYFQLSHEYEQIFVDRQRNCLRRSASLEEVYYASPIPAAFRTTNDGFLTKKDLLLNFHNKNQQKLQQPPLYYCSAPVPASTNAVPIPPPRPRKDSSKKFVSGVGADAVDFITPLTSKPSTNKPLQKLSLRNIVRDSKHLFRDPAQQVDVQQRNSSPASASTSKFYSPKDEIRKLTTISNNNNNNEKNDDSGVDEDDDDNSTSSKDKEIERRVTRARVVRRQTLMHYDQQETAFRRRKTPQLFELAVLIELRPNDRSNPIFTGKFLPAICYKFPQSTPSCADAVLASLPCLCYPDVSKAVPKNPKDFVDEVFVITITDQMGDRKFAYCCRYVPIWRTSSFDDDSHVLNNSSASSIDTDITLPSLPQVLCVLTPVHAAQFYLDFVKEGALRAKMNIVALNEFLRVSFIKPLPPPGGRLFISGAGLVKEVLLVNRTTSARAHGLSVLLERLNNIDNVLILFASLLSERRVLIVGDTVPSISKIIQASTMMLWPFEWPHTLIPVIPDSYVQLCFSPTPYLIGVLRSNLHELKHLLVGKNNDGEEEDYILIYDLDYGILKDRDSNLSSPTQSVDEAHRFLPSKVARMLKQMLKSAASISSSASASTSSSPNTIVDSKISESFLIAFVELVGHYCEFVVTQQDGNMTFQKQNFIQAATSKSHKMFLKWFVETGMFQVWMRKRLDAVINKQPNDEDIFDKKIVELKNLNGGGVGTDLFGSVAKRMASFLKSKR